MNEINQMLKEQAAMNPKSIQRYLSGLERLLADPPPGNTLAEIVAWDANWALEDPSNEGAKQWLQEVVQLLHEVLEEVSNSPE